MVLPTVIRELKDQNNQSIDNMNADWVSKAYAIGENTMLCIQLRWDDITLTGVLYLDYSGDTINDGTDDIAEDDWANFETTNVDGTFKSIMYLDKELSASSFRLRFVHTTGIADLRKVFIVRKKK